MLNTKSLIKRKKIISVQSDKEFEERNIDENMKILENEKIIKSLDTEVIKPQIFITPNKQESEKDNFFKQENNIFKQDNILREGRLGNIFDAELKKEEQKREDVIYDDQSSSYIIIDYDNLKKTLKNEDIINYIFNHKDNELIKKYIFTINYNVSNKQFEFNLIVSKFTENIEIMIKLLNYINEYINNNDNNDDIAENIDKLMIFYYQVIIFLFKNILVVSKYDKLKLAKYSSYLSYKYSTMVLKKISNIEKNNLIIKDTFQSLFDIKKDLLSQFTQICSLQNSNLEYHTSLNKTAEPSLILNRSAKYKLSSEDKSNISYSNSNQNIHYSNSNSNQNIENKVNINNMFSDSSNKSATNSENEYNIKNLMNFFTEDVSEDVSENVSNYSDDNNYQEVDIADMSSEQNILITEDKLNINEINDELNKISNNSNIPLEMSNKDTISENLYANNFESNKIKSSNIRTKSEQSYNTNSALLNSKLYELNL